MMATLTASVTCTSMAVLGICGPVHLQLGRAIWSACAMPMSTAAPGTALPLPWLQEVITCCV